MRRSRSRKARKSGDGGGESGVWLTTYADMVTLLLTFFVVLFSMSSINPVKWDKLIQTYGSQKKTVPVTEEQKEIIESLTEELPEEEEESEEDITIDYDAIQRFLRYIENPEAFDVNDIKDEASFDDFYEIMNQYIINNDLTDHVGLERDEGFVMIRFKDQAFFDSGRASLKSESVFIIRSVTTLINLVNDQVDQIKVTGYTDNVPHNGEWGIADNLELSCQRSRNVVMFLKEYGIDSTKVYTIGRAEQDPIASNETPEGRALNRRVEIIATRKELPKATEEISSPLEEAEPVDETEETEQTGETESPGTDAAEIDNDGLAEDYSPVIPTEEE